MAWQDRLLKASFAGLAFDVLRDETEFGRRLTQTEYPFRESPDVDDFGAKAFDYSLDAVFIGPDFDVQRDKFIKLASATGAGDLIHPRYGRVRARLQSARISHTAEEGGMCRAALVFVPDTGSAGDTLPAPTVDELAKALAAAGAAKTATRAGFIAKYKVLGYPSQVLQSARERVTRYGELVQSLTAPALADAQEVAEFSRQARALVNAADAVIADPLQVAERIAALSDGVRRLFKRDALAEFNRLRAAFFDPHPQGPYTTPTTVQATANADALNALVRQLSAEDAAVAAIEGDYSTRPEAEGARDDTAASLQAEAELAAGELPTLLDLRAAVLANVPAPGLRLPEVVTYRVPRTVPGLVLAYQLYGDASREAELTQLNAIAHPGFIPGGAVLEVLSDAS